MIDTNNHRPQFSKSKYEVNVPEDTPLETEVLRITATDQDEKNKLTFTLLSSTDPFSLRKFRLDPGTGVLYTAERLDHETMHQHTLTVMVRSYGLLSTSSFQLDFLSDLEMFSQSAISQRKLSGQFVFELIHLTLR